MHTLKNDRKKYGITDINFSYIMSATTSSTKPMSVSMSKSASDASMHTVSLYFMDAFRKTMKDLNLSVENEAKALDLFAKHTNDAKDVLKGKILTVTKANNKKKN